MASARPGDMDRRVASRRVLDRRRGPCDPAGRAAAGTVRPSVPRPMIRLTTTVAALCAALALASCGKDEGTLSQKRADRLDALLQQVQRQSDNGACNTLLDTTIPKL